jgi:hypothetical protein
MAAGAHYLRVAEFAPQQGIITAVRMAKIYEDAISTYRKTFREHPETELTSTFKPAGGLSAIR